MKPLFKQNTFCAQRRRYAAKFRNGHCHLEDDSVRMVEGALIPPALFASCYEWVMPAVVFDHHPLKNGPVTWVLDKTHEKSFYCN